MDGTMNNPDLNDQEKAEKGRPMKLETALSLLHKANDYLEECDWSQKCTCGCCWKCAVQTVEERIVSERKAVLEGEVVKGLVNTLERVAGNEVDNYFESASGISKRALSVYHAALKKELEK